MKKSYCLSFGGLDTSYFKKYLKKNEKGIWSPH
jgi:hypothetical protein